MYQIWVYLAETPLLWLAATIGTFQAVTLLARRLGSPPLLNPVLLTILILVPLLLVTDTPYATYFDGAQFVHFLLGPATVALAIPLYHAERKLRQVLLPGIAALVVGSCVGIASGVLLGRLVGLNDLALRSLAPRSITSPIAMGIAEGIGGLPSLTAVLVILTGMTGALCAKEVLDLCRFRDQSVRGFAIGLASHGLGTARALQLNPEAGAFAGLAMGLNGAVTALLMPWLLGPLGLQ
ncbi:MAG: LrgB family protein [Candidatus Viridilinea halotolerans]|uniref:LrgB family protein n=1 Tax=Candidatus Viridilinea halotolerans TaxID=2491704 RepID=A0A426TUQ9_9CHLR|nr:MAG: LrgB family protein [Candidatus Viridilinea halotolerans]